MAIDPTAKVNRFLSTYAVEKTFLFMKNGLYEVADSDGRAAGIQLSPEAHQALLALSKEEFTALLEKVRGDSRDALCRAYYDGMDLFLHKHATDADEAFPSEHDGHHLRDADPTREGLQLSPEAEADFALLGKERNQLLFVLAEDAYVELQEQREVVACENLANPMAPPSTCGVGLRGRRR
jgi:hypothetical protein